MQDIPRNINETLPALLQKLQSTPTLPLTLEPEEWGALLPLEGSRVWHAADMSSAAELLSSAPFEWR